MSTVIQTRAVYVGNGRVLTKILNGINFVAPSDDLVGSSSLIMDGYYEPTLTNYIVKNVTAGMTCLDVGANIGYFTTVLGLICGPSGRVIAYEANPDLRSLIKLNVNIHYMGHHVEVVDKAAYSESCRLKFNVCKRVTGNSSIFERLPGYRELYDDEIVTIHVEAVPLDERLRTISRVDFMKMDIEGGEYHAFLGMREALAEGKVRRAAVEWNRDMLAERAEPFLELLDCSFKRMGVLQGDGSVKTTTRSAVSQTTFIPNLILER
ncbi:MAG: hypothetical protein RL580_725 [Pseudomonadota bacterium]|jgi:FkbM family methyltransferase